MIQPIHKFNSSQRQKAVAMQKILWHIRWIVLSLVILFNFIGLINPIPVRFLLAIDGMGICVYLLLGQLEGYYECKINCQV